MKRNVSLSIIVVATAFALVAGLPGCVTKPTTSSRPADDPETFQRDLQGGEFGAMLEEALEDPGSIRSADSLGHFVGRWHGQGRDTNEGVVVARSPGGTSRRYHVKFGDSHGRFPLNYFDEISSAFDHDVKGMRHHRREGVGAPLLALRDNPRLQRIDDFYPQTITPPLTAVATVGARVGGVQEIRIDLVCPLEPGSDQVRVNGKTQPLATDVTVPWTALMAKAGKLKRKQLKNFTNSNPDRDPQLYLMEPYDTNKEPLIMIHGLLGTPLVWAEMSNELWADEEVRSRYQIWHFLYNTSAPALYSGRILRNQLKEVRALLDPSGRDPAMRSTTVIAHSMGGIVSRTLLTRPENAFWEAAFTQSFDSLKLSEADRDSLHEAFFWDSTPHVKRVIYIAASHLGSDFADNLFGRLGSMAAHPPKTGFKDFYERISAANPGAFTDAYKELGRGKLNSIHALSPKQPTLPILASLPNNHRVREFSIIGNEGKSGPIEESSDGMVDYWSSHIDRAESETVVPAAHGPALDHDDTIVEVKRLLKLP